MMPDDHDSHLEYYEVSKIKRNDQDFDYLLTFEYPTNPNAEITTYSVPLPNSKNDSEALRMAESVIQGFNNNFQHMIARFVRELVEQARAESNSITIYPPKEKTEK